MKQAYKLKVNDMANLSNMYSLSVQRDVKLPGDIKPCNARIVKMAKG